MVSAYDGESFTDLLWRAFEVPAWRSQDVVWLGSASVSVTVTVDLETNLYPCLFRSFDALRMVAFTSETSLQRMSL